jgi:hypothetical protein
VNFIILKRLFLTYVNHAHNKHYELRKGLSDVANITTGTLGKQWHCHERKIFSQKKHSFIEERKKTCPWELHEGLWGSEVLAPVIPILDIRWR